MNDYNQGIFFYRRSASASTFTLCFGFTVGNYRQCFSVGDPGFKPKNAHSDQLFSSKSCPE